MQGQTLKFRERQAKSMVLGGFQAQQEKANLHRALVGPGAGARWGAKEWGGAR